MLRAGERRVAAQLDLDRRREPAKIELVVAAHQEGGVGLVHLAGNPLHPTLVAPRRKQEHSRRVAPERLAGERVNLDEWLAGHGRQSCIGPGPASKAGATWPSGETRMGSRCERVPVGNSTIAAPTPRDTRG
jgi:hypothetical protein